MHSNTNAATPAARRAMQATPAKLPMGYAYSNGRLTLWLAGCPLHSRPATMAQALATITRRAMAGAVVAVGPVAQVAGYTVCGPVLQHRTQKQVAQLAAQLGAL